eukprot:188711-Rhodomonas_salina.1
MQDPPKIAQGKAGWTVGVMAERERGDTYEQLLLRERAALIFVHDLPTHSGQDLGDGWKKKADESCRNREAIRKERGR